MTDKLLINSIGVLTTQGELTLLKLQKEYYKGLKHLDKFSHCLIFTTADDIITYSTSKIINIDEENGCLLLDDSTLPESSPIFDIKPYFPCEDRVHLSGKERTRKDTKIRIPKKIPTDIAVPPSTKAEIKPKAVFNNHHGKGVIKLNSREKNALNPNTKYLRIIWWFGRFDTAQYRKILRVTPPYENAPESGVFATRSPVRPNPLATTVVKVLDYSEDFLIVSGFDGFDNTQVLEINPYNPVEDYITETSAPDWVADWQGHKDFSTPPPLSNDTPLQQSDAELFLERHNNNKTRTTQLKTTKAESTSANHNIISVKNAAANNLKNIDVTIPKDQITVITGVSGSGKSSLAFDTIYQESNRQFMSIMSNDLSIEKPDVEEITGLMPAVAIGQKTPFQNPRSTVGTLSGVSDLLRQLYANIGVRHCDRCHRGVVVHTPAEIRHIINTTDDQVQIYPQNSETEATLDNALRLGNGGIHLKINGEKYLFQSRLFCFHCSNTMFDTTPAIFSRNNPDYMCKSCKGLGYESRVIPELIVEKPELSILDGASSFWADLRKFREKPNANWMRGEVLALAAEMNVDLETPYQDLPDIFKEQLLFGSKGRKLKFTYKTSSGRSGTIEREAAGAVNTLNRLLLESSASTRAVTLAQRYTRKTPCTECAGECLAPTGRLTEIDGMRYPQAEKMSINDFKDWLENLELQDNLITSSESLIRKLLFQTERIIDMGLGYLAFNRQIPSLSGGELRRLQLSSQFGSDLTNMLYVLDEPTKGLHPKDHSKLLDKIREIRDRGNTVILVEHTRDIINNADHIIDVGRDAGKYGGNIVAQGSPDEIRNNPESITGTYLNRGITLPSHTAPVTPDNSLTISDASGHNLKNITVSFPLQKFTCVTGVSGSGKSSLVSQTLYPAVASQFGEIIDDGLEYSSLSGVDKVKSIMLVSQKPIGRTPKSIPATYVGVFDYIRECFAATKVAKQKKYRKDHFTFNGKKGQCELCNGIGEIKIPMNHMDDIWITCSHCNGKRFKDEILEVKYKNYNISEILNMEIREAIDVFSDEERIAGILSMLDNVGLSYLKLGQSATTLSGGEAQRLKLAKELCKGKTTDILYILDEPTTGLHFKDTDRLVNILKNLVANGNTVIAIEHNPDFISAADHVIELGPVGGEEGGYLID